MIAVVEAWRVGLFAPRHWGSNIIAGLVVGVIALPLALAFAIASGVKPEQGIYTAIIAGLAVSLLGGSRVQVAGPTGAFIVLLSGVVVTHGVDGLLLATLMAGVILCALGFAKLGVVIRYIPMPVVMGFTAGIGIVIFVGQWQDFFGLEALALDLHFHQRIMLLFQKIPSLNWLTFLLATGSLCLVLLPRWYKPLSSIPGPLLALVVATIIQAVFTLPNVATIGTQFGGIPIGLPHFALPEWTMDRLVELMAPAFAIAMLGAIESLLSAMVADSLTGTKHNPNTELVGQGIANILSPMFGGIAATGAIARTGASIKNGGTSPLAGIVHALFLVLVLLVLAPLASNVPLAALAAILFVVAWDMSSVSRIVQLFKRAPRSDIIIFIITILLTVFVDLVVAVNIGTLIAVFYFLRQMSNSVDVVERSPESLKHRFERAGFADPPANTKVYIIRGPLFFAGLEWFVKIQFQKDVQVLFLQLDEVPFADATALWELEKLVIDLQSRGARLFLSGANKGVIRQLKRMGLYQRLGEQNIFPNLQTAINYLYDESIRINESDID